MENNEEKTAVGEATPAAAVQNVQTQYSTSASVRQGGQIAPPQAQYRSMASVQSKPITWLWPNVFAQGKFSLISGHPGLGKSQVSLYLAATVSQVALWPASTSAATGGNVIIISAEDDPADTIKPRLEALGANMDRIYILDTVTDSDKKEPRTFSLKNDIYKLASMLEEIDDVSLVIIDPISAYTAGVDNHKDADLRQILSPLSKLAEKYNVAIVGIAHLNKGGEGKEAITRTSGSMALIAAARAAWYVIRDDATPDRRLFVPAKNNIGKDDVGYAFHVLPKTLQSGIETSYVKWETATVAVNISALMSSGQSAPSEIERAIDFIKEILANGFLPSNDVYEEAKNAGFSRSTVIRAKERIGIKPVKQSSKEWTWALPETGRNSTCSPHLDEQDEHLDCL